MRPNTRDESLKKFNRSVFPHAGPRQRYLTERLLSNIQNLESALIRQQQLQRQQRGLRSDLSLASDDLPEAAVAAAGAESLNGEIDHDENSVDDEEVEARRVIAAEGIALRSLNQLLMATQDQEEEEDQDPEGACLPVA